MSVISWIIIGLFVAAGFGALAVSGTLGAVRMGCPYCNKGVKLGATHCHHCGRDVRRRRRKRAA